LTNDRKHENWTEPVRLDERPEHADWLRRVPAQFDTVEKGRAWLKKRGEPVEHFKASALYKNSVDRMPWLRDL
jgi:hypothetical protein